jgi:hypothetical protein
MWLTVLFLTCAFVIGDIVVWRALRGRRDRSPGRTISMLILSGICWSLAFQTLGWTVAALALLGLLVLVSVFTGAGVELAELRDRRVLRDTAVAGGMSGRQARRSFRRAPRSPSTVIAIWFTFGLAWVVALGELSGELRYPAPFIDSPAWSIPWLPLSTAFPWWVWVSMAIAIGGPVHMMVNMLRQGDDPHLGT